VGRVGEAAARTILTRKLAINTKDQYMGYLDKNLEIKGVVLDATWIRKELLGRLVCATYV
jgi:hypothetical protein